MTTVDDIDVSQLKEINSLEGSLAQRVYLSLKDAILTLAFPPGAILRKGAICEALGVSRSPVSEAIARLSAEGLVDVIPQSATRASYFSMEEIREGAFLREALELAAVGKVARDCTDEQIAKIRRNFRMQLLSIEDGDFAGFYQSDEEFHAMLMEFTGYSRLKALSQMVSLQVTRARMILLPSPGRAGETVEEHRAIVDAITDRDPARAQAAMQAHLAQLVMRLAPLETERPELFRP